MKHCLFVILFVLVCTGGTASARFKPNFNFTDLDGQKYSTASLHNTPLVIYVGSTF